MMERVTAIGVVVGERLAVVAALAILVFAGRRPAVVVHVHQVEVPPPAPAPVLPPPTAVLPHDVGEPELDRASIQAALSAAKPALHACHAEIASSETRVHVKVSAAGEVTNVGGADACVAAVLRHLKLAPTRAGGSFAVPLRVGPR